MSHPKTAGLSLRGIDGENENSTEDFTTLPSLYQWMVKSKHALFTHSKSIIIIINLFITSLYQYCKCEREERRFRMVAAYPPLAEKTGKVVKSKIKTL